MTDSLIVKLSALGCNFALQERGTIADPEKVILESLIFFWRDKKIFTMLIALLKYRIHQLINVKRLYSLSKNLDSEKKAVLRVLALKVYRHTGDVRFEELGKKLKKKNVKIKNYPKMYSDDFYKKKKGVDKDFSKVGIKVADFFEEQPEKKLKTIKRIYHENEWFRLRAISGPDYRADTLFLLKKGLAKTQSEVSGWLGCNKSSISRIWASVKNIEDLVVLI